jgi:FtsP/CotA-like multicopper oxidase with cupredoxin domain
MTENIFKLLQSISSIHVLLQKNNITLSDNIALKRKFIGEFKEHELNVDITQEEYNSIINDVISLLEESGIDEDYLISQIDDLFKQSIVDSNVVDFCLLALEEIGNELILTGDYIDPAIGGDENNPENAIEHAYIGGDVHENVTILEENLLGPRLFNIPTDKQPSPSVFTVDDVTYDVSEPFTQQILRFEELGRLNIDKATDNGAFDPELLNIPQPDADGFPISNDFNNFMHNVTDMSGNLGFVPTKLSNIDNPNPWADKIKEIIDPPDFVEGVAEGRASGVNGSHHKWKEDSPPKVISITCQTGATRNNGWRDNIQMHEYKHGEFGPNGLYHKVLDSMDKSGTTNGIVPKFHDNLPVQKKDTLWTFDGTFPPKLLVVKYGEPHIQRHYNFLPIKPDKNRGFGMHTITTHEHNGSHNGSSDGFAQSFFFPGEYYDYFYAMTLAGFTHINTEAIHPKAAIPMDWKRDEEGDIIKDDNNRPIPEDNLKIPGDWKETMSTHWFHDHMLDYTAQNVYKGNAAMMNYYSALDRGNEEIEDGINLRLPSGNSLSWGNRDYDVNLMIMDKAWDNEGQLWFNPFNTNGFLGDKMMVNWLLEPYFEVRARRYRFRILNAAVSRFMKFALVRKYNDNTSGNMAGPNGSNTSYDRVPFWMIANCGNLLMHSIKFDGTKGTTNGVLPVQAIAERFDIIVDFSEFEVGDKLYFVNVLEHFNGKRPNKEVPLSNILNNTYTGDPCVMKFMEFRIKEYDDEDLSLHPSIYEVGKRMLIPIEPLDEDDIRNAKQRNFNFVNKLGTTAEWAIETDGGQDFQMDPRRLSAAPTTNQLEIWTIRNGAVTWAHNVHIHYTEGKILLRNGQLPPIWEQFARKDVYRVGGGVDSSESLVVALKFNDIVGDTYMMHCHSLVHEDLAMLLRFDVASESCIALLPCPLPTWNGVKFMETKALPTYRTGMKKDNMFYNHPERIIKKLKQIDKVVPDESIGAYFVNGLGKSLQLSEDD